MTFLNPAILLAVLAAALPILIHLLNLRRRKPMLFSSLQLVRELQKSSIRRFKIRQWLLLALRSLAILFLVSAFSKPVIEGYLAGGGFSSQTRTSALILLDTSPSMQYNDQNGHDQWKEAKQAALKVLDNLGNDDDVFLSLLKPDENFSEPISLTEARHKIIDAEISFSSLATEERMREGLVKLARSKHFNREAYIISDFHASGFLSSDTARTSDKTFTNIKTYFIDVGIPDKHNAGILESEVVSKIFEPGKPVRVRATFGFSGLTNNDGLGIELRFNDKLAKENGLYPDTSNVMSTTFSAIPRDNGFISCTVLLPDDNLAADNKHYSAFYIPTHLRLLFVYNNPTEISFLKHALESYENSLYFDIELSSEQQLDARNLSPFDAVVLAGVTRLSSASIKKIARYIEQGGGVLLFASPVLQHYESHNLLLKTIGAGKLSPEPSELKGSPRSIDRIDYRHPLFDGVFIRPATANSSRPSQSQTEQDFPKLMSAAFYQKSGNETVLASFGGTPLATTLSYGSGKCVIFSTIPAQQTTTLVFDPVFAPMMFRSIFWTTAKTEVSASSFTLGSRGEMALPQTITPGENLIIKKPDGKTFIPELRQRPDGTRLVLKPESFNIPGIYEVVREIAGSGIQDRAALIAFNISPAESDSKKIGSEALGKTAEQMGISSSAVFYVNAIKSVDPVSEAISGSRFGLGIWKYLAGLAAICLVAESIVGRKTTA